MKNTKNKLKIFFVAAAMIAGAVFSGSNIARAVPTNQIYVSAYLINDQNTPVNNGDYDVRFAIYRTGRTTRDPYPSDADAGSRVWQETQKVTIMDGVIGAYLGSVTPLPATLNFNDGDYYLGIRIGMDSEMVPRKKIGAIPIAINSLFLNGATTGTAAGNIPVLGSNGKIDVKNLPTGTGSSQLVLGNDSRLQSSKLSVSGSYKYVSVSGMKITLKQVNLGTDITGTLPVAHGGTGLSTIPTGSLIYADTFNHLAALTGTETEDGYGLQFNWNGGSPYMSWSAAGAGGMNSFNLAGDSGTDQPITNGNTLTIAGGTNINTAAGATDTVTVNLNSTLSGVTWNGNLISSGYLASNVMLEGENISLLNNNSGFISAASSDTLTNKSGNISMWTNNAGYITVSSADVLTNKTWHGNPVTTAYGGTGLNSFTHGDILYYNSGATLTALGIGSNGQVLVVSGGIPTWSASAPTYPHNLLSSADHPDTATGTVTRGDLIVGNSSNLWARMAVGTAGNIILTNNGTDVSWNSISSLGLATLAGTETLTNKTIGSGSSYQGNTITTSYGGTGLTSYASGVILYGNGGNTLATLAPGSNGNILSLSGGLPGWIPTTNITTVGTVTSGTWNATTVDIAHGGTNATTAANARTNLGLGALATLSSVNNSNWSGAQLSVANGGTGTTTGSITGSGTLAFTAGGSGNNITLTPSGSGIVAVAGSLGIQAGSFKTIFQGSGSQISDLTYVLPSALGITGQFLTTDDTGNLSWANVQGGTGGIGTVTSVGSGNGLTGGPITASGTLSVNLMSAYGGNTLNSSPSGLQFSGAGNNQLALLQGCVQGDVLSWDSSSKVWYCASVTGVGAITGGGSSGQVAYWNGATSVAGENHLSVGRGGTGVGTFGGTNTLLYTTSADTLSSIATGNSSVLATNGSGIPAWTTDLPTGTTVGGAYVYRAGGNVIAVTDGGTGLQSYTAGDLIYAPSNNTLATLSAGAGNSGRVLVVNGSGIPTWSTSAPTYPHNLLNSADHPDTTTGTVARGDLIVGSSSNLWARLGHGSSGDLLTYNGSDVAWNSPAGLSLATLSGTETLINKTIGSGSNYQGSTITTTYGGTGIGTAYSQGDILYYNAGVTLSRLARGSDGNVLTLSGGIPAWSSTAPPAPHNLLNSTQHPDTTTATVVRGGLITGQGTPTTTWSLLNPGTAGYFLKANGVGAELTWAPTTDITSLGTITTGIWNGTTIAVANGGTGSTTASGARTNLGLAINTDVQAYNANLAAIAGSTWTGASSITTLGTIGTGTWNGTAISATHGGTGITAYSTGDMPYATGANTLGNLTVGTNGQVLVVAGGVPTWSSTAPGAAHNLLSTSHGDTTAASVVRGDLITGQGAAPNTKWARLPVGSSGYVLKTDGADAYWGSISGGSGGGVDPDSLDFTEFKDAMTLDNDLTISAGAGNYSINIDSNTFYIDSANNRVGIGTNAPGATFTVGANAFAVSSSGTVSAGTWNGMAIAVANGGTGATDAATARTNLGLAIGTNVEAYNASLVAIAAGTWTGANSITSLGTITAGTWNGTTIAVVNGGTGATAASGARTNLGLAINTDVQAYNANLAAIAGGTWTGANSITTLGTITTGTWNGTTMAVANGGTGSTTASGARTNLGLGGLATLSSVGSSEITDDSILEADLHATTSPTDGYVLVYDQGSLGFRWSQTATATIHNLLSGIHGDTSITGSVAQGDLIYRNGSSQWTNLPIGTSGYFLKSNGTTVAWAQPTKSDVGLGNVENTTLSTWAGTSNITTLGTIGTGTWNGTAIAVANGGTGATDAATARTNLGLAIGTNVQAYNASLAAIAGGTWTGANSITTLGTIGTGTWNGTAIAAANGGTGNTSYTTGDLLYASGATTLSKLADVAAGSFLRSGGAGVAPAWSTATYPGTTTANQILYSSANNTVTGLATANSGILVTSGAGVPSIATDIPTAVTIGGSYIYRAGGTDVTLADGGTGASLTASNGGIVYSGASSLAVLAANANSGLALVSGGAGAPSWFAPTQGSILFAGANGALSQNNTNFYWNDSNTYLKLGDGSANKYSLGVDSTDSDKFKIYAGTGVAGTSQFMIDSSGTTSIANLQMGAQTFPADAGMVSWIDMPVSATPTAGTVESYSAQLDGNPMLTIYGQADHAGGLTNLSVGIGQTSPAASLDILNSSTSNGLALKGTTTLQQATGNEVAYQLNYTTNKATSGNDTGLLIKMTDTVSPGTSYLIDAQVGSTSEFHVDNAGMGYFASGINVNGTNVTVPDYVFEPGYNLMPLSDLTNYIALNQHLPGIPSEADIHKNGLNYSNMIMDLLQKTEENTLYIVQNNQQLTTNFNDLSAANQDLVLKTDQNITTLQQLQDSIDKNLATVQSQLTSNGSELDNINQQLTDHETRIKTLEDLVATLQAQMNDLKNIANQELNVAQIEANKTDIDYIKTVLGFDTAENGSISLVGNMEAQGVVAGAFTIKVTDQDAPTIGQNYISAPKTDTNGNVIEDGRTFFIKTKAVSKASRIFVTPKDMTDQPIVVTEIKAGEGFTVAVKNTLSNDLHFDWMIVGELNNGSTVSTGSPQASSPQAGSTVTVTAVPSAPAPTATTTPDATSTSTMTTTPDTTSAPVSTATTTPDATATTN